MSVLVIGKFKGDTASGAPEPPEVIVAQAISSPDEF